jgi:hypothetical protein
VSTRPRSRRHAGIPFFARGVWLALALAACASRHGVGPGPGHDGGLPPDLASPPSDAGEPPADGSAPPDLGTPALACKTHYLDPQTYLSGAVDSEWYVDNIPFLDVPDSATKSAIQPIYYYRWSTLKRAIRYTDPTNGYVFLEFLEPPGYASAFGAVNAAAGHHLYEARWLHDSRYGDDYLNYWLNGAGKAGVRQYSFWVADSTWARYLVSGDGAFAQSLLTALKANYEAWADHFDSTLGLYWQVPVWDAMEYMADTYSTENPDKDPYHGGPGYRPTINAYQYADALAIANIAQTFAGDMATATSYRARATALQSAMQTNLWSPTSHFFVHRYRDSNALFDQGGGREEIGFVPWQFEMPQAGYESSWQDTIMNPSAFYTAYGPTTVAKDNPLYLYSYSKGACCHWNGPLWPYSTTQTLKAMANLINDYQQSYVGAADYFTLLDSFAKSQFKNGEPYVAEALDPDDTTGAPIWAYDSPSHSEHYNHSGFVDLVISGLIGLHPSADDLVHVKPLTPAAWDHFMLENVSYHGHYLTIVWDQNGTYYNAGTGFTIVEDCNVLHTQPTLGAVDVPLANGSWAPAPEVRLNNVLANVNPTMVTYPKASASYTWSGDNIVQINDGLVIYDKSVNGSPNNAQLHNRWTNYGSKNASDWVAFDLGAAQTLSELTLHLYSDGNGVTAPASYTIETSTDGATWSAAANVQSQPATPVAGPNVARFTAVAARYVRVTFPTPQCPSGTGCAGVTELESWVAP